MKNACAAALLPLLLLGACGGKTSQPALEPVAKPELAPPITAPHEDADPALPPSYEVAIAGAAAEHNAAKKRCAEQPESVRAQCEQEANAAFSTAQGDLERLRGNQP
jgi:hypothetical protein